METMENSSPSGDVNRRKYFPREKFILKMLGISLIGNESFGYKIYSYFVLSIFIVYPLFAAGDLFKHEFEVVAAVFVYVIGSTLGSSIALVVFRNRKRLGKLIISLENEPFIANPERGGDVEDKLISGWYRFSTIQGLLYFVCGVVTVSYQVIYTLTLRIKSNDYRDWRFPFGPLTILNVTYSPNFEISWFYQGVSIMLTVCSTTSCTIILAGSLAYISVQFKILQNNLRRLVENSHRLMLKDNSCHLERNGVADPSTIPWKYLKISVKEAVLYHLSIIEILKEIEDIFSMLMLSTYFCILSIVCFDIYRASLLSINDPRMSILLSEAPPICLQALLICFCGELVAQESEGVGRAAFEVNLIGSDLRFQKALIFIMRKSQTPMRIKAGKFIETSLITFVWILRSAYSAFMMLRKVNNE